MDESSVIIIITTFLSLLFSIVAGNATSIEHSQPFPILEKARAKIDSFKQDRDEMDFQIRAMRHENETGPRHDNPRDTRTGNETSPSASSVQLNTAATMTKQEKNNFSRIPDQEKGLPPNQHMIYVRNIYGPFAMFKLIGEPKKHPKFGEKIHCHGDGKYQFDLSKKAGSNA